MSDILLASDGDIDTTGNVLKLTSGSQAVKQRLEQRLRLIFQEWFLERTRGVPYFTQIFVKQANPVVIDAIFKREILSEPAVQELQAFNLDLEPVTRVLTVTMTLKITDEPVDLSVVIAF